MSPNTNMLLYIQKFVLIKCHDSRVAYTGWLLPSITLILTFFPSPCCWIRSSGWIQHLREQYITRAATPRDKKRSTSSARVSRRRFISLRESNKMDGRQIKQILPQTREIDESTSVYDGWNREYT